MTINEEISAPQFSQYCFISEFVMSWGRIFCIKRNNCFMFSTNNQIHGSVDFFCKEQICRKQLVLQTEYHIFQTKKSELFTRNTDEY